MLYGGRRRAGGDPDRNRSVIVPTWRCRRARKRIERSRRPASDRLELIGLARTYGGGRGEKDAAGAEISNNLIPGRVSTVARSTAVESPIRFCPLVAAGHVRCPAKSRTPRRPLVTELIRRIGSGCNAVTINPRRRSARRNYRRNALRYLDAETASVGISLTISIVFDSSWILAPSAPVRRPSNVFSAKHTLRFLRQILAYYCRLSPSPPLPSLSLSSLL